MAELRVVVVPFQGVRMRFYFDFVRRPFENPLKAFTVGVVVALILLPIMGSVIWGMYEALSRIGLHEFRLQKLSGTISNLHEALSMSARMAAATGDATWEARYRSIEPELDSSIVEVALLARAEYQKNYAAQTKLAYTKLIEMESVALALVRGGRREEAAALLFSQDYNQYKVLYAKGLQDMTEAVQARIVSELHRFRTRMWGTGILGLLSFAVLVTTWTGISMVVKRQLKRRKQAEEALANERELFLVPLRSIGDGVITTATSGSVTLMNPVAEELTGWKEEDALGRPIEEAFVVVNEKTGKSVANPVARVLSTGTVCGLANHTLLVARDGTERSIADSGAPIRDTEGNVVGVVLVFRDVTEEQHMLREAAKAEKLESVGLLAGGIAHDFNNILAGFMGNISLAKIHMDPEAQEFKRLSAAERAVDRAKDLTQQLLTFSKGGAPIKKTASLPQLLAESAGFALRGSHTSCELRMAPDLWDAEVDEGQVSRVIHNLLVNADQAMPDGGRIYLSAENYAAESDDRSVLAAGTYVRISVKDEGIGVPAEHLHQIFDPYFTTKKTGSGLGLATSYAIVKRHGGHIAVRSQVGRGTTFEVFLPTLEKRTPIKPEVAQRPKNGEGRILLMDDEEVVRELAGEMLTLLGYRVTLSKDGAEAIDLYRQAQDSGDPFNAVIMDLTIPGGLGGKEAFAVLQVLNPDVRAIVSSGYCTDPIMGDYKKYGFCGVLPKPYDANAMGEVLYDAISATA
jgi:PAS domain S-box-containing protein